MVYSLIVIGVSLANCITVTVLENGFLHAITTIFFLFHFQWLELSLDEEVPATLLLLSRTLYMQEQLSSPQHLKITISQLPERVVSLVSFNE